MTVPGDDLAFLHGLHHLFPLQDLLGLALAQPDHAVGIVGHAGFVFHLFDQHLNDLTDLRRLFVLIPFVARNRAFALVSDVDEDGVVVDADDPAVDDLVDVEVGLGFDLGVDRFRGIAHRRLKHGFQGRITFQTANEISIYHCTLNRLPPNATNPMLSRTAGHPPVGIETPFVGQGRKTRHVERGPDHHPGDRERRLSRSS